MKPLHIARAARGFTLIEVLITLLVVAVGILGMAKLQAAAVAESKVSNVRSLMAYQGESLAGMMRSNRSYWAAVATTAPSFTWTAGGTYPPSTSSVGTMTAPTTSSSTCVVSTAPTGPTCTTAQIAYDDVVNNWLLSFKTQFPTANATIACVAASATVPGTCDITLTWTESHVSINSDSKSPASTVVNPSMVLHVQP